MKTNKDKQEEMLHLLYNSLESWIELKAEEHMAAGASQKDAESSAKEEIVESINYDFA